MFSLSKEKTWIKLALLLMLVITLAMSLFAIFKYGNYFLLGSMDKMDNDDVKYVRSAITLLEKGMFTYHDVNTPTVFIMPGHPVLLAGIMQIFGTGDSGITAFRVFQALLQACCLYLIFLIGREVFNSKVALLACLIDALYISNGICIPICTKNTPD
jgi:4-amino-4-deoxy-L-arabinose transferase-like glycosyltransferase